MGTQPLSDQKDALFEGHFDEVNGFENAITQNYIKQQTYCIMPVNRYGTHYIIVLWDYYNNVSVDQRFAWSHEISFSVSEDKEYTVTRRTAD